MVGIAEISAGIGSIKAAFGILKALNATATQVSINEVKFELGQHLLDAQGALTAAMEAQSAASERIRQLEQQIAGMENWEAEKQRYELKAIDTGAVAYMHKPGMENGEPAIWLCQTCFENRHKSPLQFRAQDRGSGAAGGRGSHSRWGCNLCKGEVVVYYHRNPATPWPESSPEPDPSPPSGMTSVKLARG